ncbi:glycosyl transferase group 1 [Thiorhodococcus drewsii AZ1]|uniref:Glycosyl transferase group 1 n=1 Tax=Thiorhodococcus drewsii AZ1 TaxID=765913 RepID=G2E2C2_9GAMM|nr:glycosyltransferase [Thiorhodococcus drewsii]EGV30838.1 glycosyl transferase group 1 [Thiorhodococcus drewsii AZ1]
MRYCDLTLAYTETSGGIRTYIDQKRRYIDEQTDDEHLLIVPGERDHCERQGRLCKIEIESPLIPGCEPYRFFWRPDKIRRALADQQPDVVELGSYFLSPWAAFRYRDERRAEGLPTLVSVYFHTDVAHAYVGAPVRRFFGEGMESVSDTLALWGHKLGEILEDGAESAFGQMFRKCDLTLAATQAQAARVADYGVQGTEIVPLGVDLSLFSPERRSAAARERLGVAEDDILLIYCGRLDSEKAVTLLVDVFERLPAMSRFHLVLVGEGPLRAELEARAGRFGRVHVLPYEKDKSAYATLLASADLYVTAGPHETFGLAVVEAEASGLPVVGVDAGALRERVRSDWGRLGPVGDAGAMVGNILEILPRCRDMGRAARRHVLEAGYGWDRSFERLFELYRKGLSQSADSDPAGSSKRTDPLLSRHQ